MAKVSNTKLEDLIAEGQNDAKKRMDERKRRDADAKKAVERAEKIIRNSMAFGDGIKTHFLGSDLIIESAATPSQKLLIIADLNSISLCKMNKTDQKNPTVIFAADLLEEDETTLCLFYRLLGEYLTYFESGAELPPVR